MKRTIQFLPEVFDDLSKAVFWYDNEGGKELGDRYLETFYSRVPEIVQNPEIHRPVYREFRRIIMEPFPYKVFFRMTGEFVVIVAVVHAARNPQFVGKLLGGREFRSTGR